MSAQGDDFLDLTGSWSQARVEIVQEIMAVAAEKIRDAAAWPARLWLMPPGTMVVEDHLLGPRKNDEYVFVLAVPALGQKELWRHAALIDKVEQKEREDNR